MKKIFALILCFMIGCGGISVIEVSTGTGGAGGSEMTSSQSSGGGGASTSTDTETISDSTTDSTTSTDTMTTTSTITSTEGYCANVPDTFFCSHDGFICCDKIDDPSWCSTSELGYCCPNDYFCVPH